MYSKLTILKILSFVILILFVFIGLLLIIGRFGAVEKVFNLVFWLLAVETGIYFWSLKVNEKK